MATLIDRIDRFVRWFFNSSPDGTLIRPRPGIRRSAGLSPRREIVRRSVFAGAAAVAILLLGMFYSVVAAAVDRAATRRAQAAVDAVALRSSARAPARPVYFAPRKVSLARASS